MLFIYFLCENKKYHNNPYFQTLFVRFALDWNGKNIYVLSLNPSATGGHDIRDGTGAVPYN